MHSSNSSLTTTKSPHLLRVNNRVVTAKVLPKVQLSSSPCEIETSNVVKQGDVWQDVYCSGCYSCHEALGGSTHKPVEGGWAKPSLS